MKFSTGKLMTNAAISQAWLLQRLHNDLLLLQSSNEINLSFVLQVLCSDNAYPLQVWVFCFYIN